MNKYSNNEVLEMRKQISLKEGIPYNWLIYNAGTENHFGTCIPNKFIFGGHGVHINLEVYNIKEYFK